MDNTGRSKGLKPLRKILSEIECRRKFLVTTHQAPDGDALGAQIAVASWIRSLGKEAIMVNERPVPRMYRFLPGAGNVRTLVKPAGKFSDVETVIILDCSSYDRIGAVARLIPSGVPVINIDHHVSNERFGTINWIEPDRSSTGEMCFLLLSRSGKISCDMATCLYAAILTDTGSFHYHFDWKTLHVTEELLKLGVDAEYTARRIYCERPVQSLQLLAMALGTIGFDARLRVAWMSVTSQMYRATGTDEEDTEGMVEILRTVADTDFVFLIKERKNEIKFSLRSERTTDVLKLAAAFGGGGHINAAGFSMKDVTLNEAREIFLSFLRKHGKFRLNARGK
jgi:phosphoesterase RecJ-like protein